MAEEKLKHVDIENDDLNNHQLGVYHFCLGDIFEHQYDENEKAKAHFRISVEYFMKKNYINEILRSQNHLAQILIKQDRSWIWPFGCMIARNIVSRRYWMLQV
ncbi:hypothetical protein [Guptibacillus hwajinpoensis]|uniref:hypothetical protein n=1 Tax=Guptibacillus hwajinpoensis TaxID=208199 RepID=UPI003D6A05D9